MSTATIKGFRNTGTGRQKEVDLTVELAGSTIAGASGGGGAKRFVASAALVANDLVYIDGWNVANELPTMGKADNDASGKHAQYVIRDTIASGAIGVAYTTHESAANLNTDGASAAGDPVYLDATAGGWTVTAPTAAAAVVQIVGRVQVKSATVGVVQFDLGDFPTVGTNDLQAKAVTAAKIADATITTSQISATAGITGAQLAANAAIAGTQLAAAAGITSAQLANGAGVAALLAAGLGGSASVLKTDTATHTIVAAHGSKDRAVIVMVVVDETYAVGTGTLPALVIGEADTTNKFMAAGTLDTEAAGTVLFFAGTNTATKAITATSTAAVGNATGGCSITVLAIPTT